MQTVSFKTRARTVDHLGREQIADVPTAISELWKNSYDAYARKVSLTIFDETPLVVSITDDGHGMNHEELVDRWLVVGTESKLFEDTRSKLDMDGLALRSRQGQKGIGRLSSAHLGSIMLLMSKRRGQKTAAALIDWRLFENPFLILSDIEIPVVSLGSAREIQQQLPEMISALLHNVLGDGTGSDREKRVISAWTNYDHVLSNGSADSLAVPPSQLIIESFTQFRLNSYHLDKWPVWTGERDHGTAMVVAHANDEFSVFLPASKDLRVAEDDRKRFLVTLGGFVDPLFDPTRPDIEAVRPEFDYYVDVLAGGKLQPVISSDDDFNRTLTDRMEHILDGRIGEDGVFRGQIKSFGKWRKTGSDYVIAPPKDFTIPLGISSRLGPMDIYVATFEQEEKNSTHTPAEMKQMWEMTANHSGLMIYRDSLRVLPYGREDNDFFEIEKRRSINAGREYWNARRMFGRIAITRNDNPNLKDKAGREGFIVNRAAKTLKILVTNILRAAAYDYFGSNSEDREVETSITKRNFAEQRAKEHQARLRKSHRTKFRAKLKEHLVSIPSVTERIKHDVAAVRIETPEDITLAQEILEKAQDTISELRLPGAPSPLGSLEVDYRSYRKSVNELAQLVTGFSEYIAQSVEKVSPKSPHEILVKQIQRNEAQLSSRVTKWSKEIRSLLEGEHERIGNLVSERNKLLRLETTPLIGEVEEGRMSLSTAAKAVSMAKARIENENELLFQNYILALENMRDSIDVQAVAVLGGDESNDLRAQVDRLNGLAQLGITVEFLDHEFHAHDSKILNGLAKLKSNPNDALALQRVDTGYSGLKQIMDFLGPLRIAGRVRSETISGKKIYDYVADFFARIVRENGIKFSATDAFLEFSIYEQPSRLLPVFINLINNSIYWVINSQVDVPRIVLDYRDGEAIIADNGPGIDDIDIKRLFTLFFTRKIEGGRGVGLYLCQANLAAGGHRISYVQDNDRMVLPGANFAITFRGANINE